MKPTINGYDVWECISAFQKSIRRGLEEDAMYWAVELIESGFFNIVKSRIRVIAHEDIGIADKLGFLCALRSLDDLEYWHSRKKGSWRLALANVILSLCRSKKSREADHFQCVIIGMRNLFNRKLDMPDYAIDKHTMRGKKMKRGILHFLKYSAKLEPPNPEDKYEDRAAKIWTKCEDEKLKLHNEEKSKEPLKWGDPKRKEVENGQIRL